MEEKVYTITQKRFLRGSQTLALEGNTLKLQCRRGLSLQEYFFDLRGLLPDPMRFRHVPLVKIVGLTLAGVLGLFLIPFGIMAETSLNMGQGMSGLSALGLVLLLIGSLGWILTARQLVDVLVFEGPGGRVVLWPNRPNTERFNEFIAVLTARIRNAQGYERMVLRRLRQAGIIDDWQYDQGMELFESQGDRRGNG